MQCFVLQAFGLQTVICPQIISEETPMQISAQEARSLKESSPKKNGTEILTSEIF